MARIKADYVFGTTDTTLTATDTTLSSPELSRLPAVTGADIAAVTLHDSATGTYEIVHVTAHAAAATTATILRGQEGSTATSWLAGSSWLHGATVEDFTSGGGVQTIVPGDNIAVDNTDPSNPIVSATGSAGRPLVDPTGLSWSWVNQGVATIATQGASLLLSSPAESADSWHMRVKAVPAKPYSIIIHQKVTRMSVNYASAGVGWLQSSNNYFAGLFQRGGGMVMSAAYSQAPFGLTANYKEISGDRIWEWIKLTDDATNRQIYVSADGYNWVLFHTVATNSIITPDRVFFGIEARNPDYGIGQTIDSWEEA